MYAVITNPWDPCISIVKVWYSNKIRITQIECGLKHIIALDTEGRVYWFGRFKDNMPLSHVSSDSIPFSRRITDIRSGCDSVACKDKTNEWYVWGCNSFSHITGLCGCEAICKKTKNDDIISNPMQCKMAKSVQVSSCDQFTVGITQSTCHC